ncbi:MAG: oligoendopeptidase F [candidate division Zixibacteria bacterium]|nr:oligoendopeptidase F [candidate division Zixibacteria bacterium]
MSVLLTDHQLMHYRRSGALLAATVGGKTKKVKQRSEIEDKHKWRLTDIYRSDKAWQDDFARLKEMIGRIGNWSGKLADSGDSLFSCLDQRDQTAILFSKLQTYAYLKLDEDNRESRYQAMVDEISALGTILAEAGSFIAPEIMAISAEQLEEMKAATERLKLYDHHLDNLRRLRAHILSPAEEKIIALSGNVSRSASQIFRMIDDADLQFGTVTDEEGLEIALTKQRYYDLLEAKDRNVRKEAMRVFNRGYLTYRNTLGATLAASVYNDFFHTQVRKYDSCLQASLDTDNIPEKTYQNLIETVADNLAALHRYTSLRKRVLGYDELYPYDMYVPLVPEAKLKIAYDEAVSHLLEGLAPLGREYIDNLKMAIESGWIDVFETECKGSGAYSWSTYATHSFVLMNYNDTLDNMFTLAHELGHALHSYYSKQHQPYIYSGHAIFTAEVASTTNEAILMHYMLQRTSDKEQKAYLLNYNIQQIVGTFFTQTMYSQFEDQVHADVEAGRPLTADSFRQAFRRKYQKFWGPELTLLEESDSGCLRIPHFYRSFYVYQYATSYAAATLISQRILAGDKEMQDKYLNFLKAGESKYPIDILKDAGVDLTKPDPIKTTIELFGRLVKQLEQLLMP